MAFTIIAHWSRQVPKNDCYSKIELQKKYGISVKIHNFYLSAYNMSVALLHIIKIPTFKIDSTDFENDYNCSEFESLIYPWKDFF